MNPGRFRTDSVQGLVIGTVVLTKRPSQGLGVPGTSVLGFIIWYNVALSGFITEPHLDSPEVPDARLRSSTDTQSAGDAGSSEPWPPPVPNQVVGAPRIPAGWYPGQWGKRR